ncbi:MULTISPECIES: polymer-forming cytoskeletal protein [unclassified Iodidimonas]|jgi:cytoskeletal protein CcmA (bactofilin family)|uniref:bactofilin family protein n=1 Tax=unclassified Iodidimonas TaxID=2626145 RepID=UPI002482A372|nr:MULTISPECIES: polymer-forming cytoskeletal protein [unclassified Iodidimonas]
MTEKANKPDYYEFFVGEHSSMEGAEMSITGTARIDGRLTGKIYADHLIVGETGYVAGEISGQSAEISGTLEQSITLKKKLKVMKSGRVSGRISYGSIDIDEGATITGELHTDSDKTSGVFSDSESRLNQVSKALGFASGSEAPRPPAYPEERPQAPGNANYDNGRPDDKYDD